MMQTASEEMSRTTPEPVSSETAWAAVLARDARFEGRFVYGVRSTGVFCRPSCPSRRPNRDRVAFFADPAAARAAGFRACKRCRPEQALPGREAIDRTSRPTWTSG